MPKYTWYGIDIEGATCQGVLSVYSHKQLQEDLLKKDIAVLSYSVKAPWSYFNYPSQHTIISFFDALATLLEAGVFLDVALSLLKNKQVHNGFRMLIEDVQNALHDGVSFSQALYPYNAIFGVCALELVTSGESVDALPQALRLVTKYYAHQTEFTKRVKKVMLLPAITFIFFIIIAVVILTYIVPVFASLFISAQKDLPWITRFLLQLSNWCVSVSFFTMGSLFILPCYIIKKCFEWQSIKRIKDKYILFIPLFGRLIYKQNMYQFLQTTAMLLAGGIHEISALQAACVGLYNEHIKNNIQTAVGKVKDGENLADALHQTDCVIVPEVQAIMAVGQESNTFACALERGAQWYKQDLENLLHIISSLVQPGLMIILGIFITILIFAIYMPVLQLSYVIM